MINKNFFLAEFMSKILVGQINKKLIISQKCSSIQNVKKSLDFLVRNGYIYGYNFEINNSLFLVFLKYDNSFVPIIKNLLLYSKPGKKVYISIYKLKALVFLNKTSLFLLSTTKGLLTHNEAILYKIGGKLLVKLN